MEFEEDDEPYLMEVYCKKCGKPFKIPKEDFEADADGRGEFVGVPLPLPLPLLESSEEDINEADEDDSEELVTEYICEDCTLDFLDEVFLQRYLGKATFDPQTASIERQKKIIEGVITGDDISKDGAVRTIGMFASQGNKDAIEYTRDLLTTLDLPLKKTLVASFSPIDDKQIKEQLIDIIRTTKSNNTTRGLINETLKAIKYTRDKSLIEPLYLLTKTGNFTYRMKNKIYEVIDVLNGRDEFA